MGVRIKEMVTRFMYIYLSLSVNVKRKEVSIVVTQIL